jgi:two-component system, OmpR family, sensor histidine kinase ChvG
MSLRVKLLLVSLLTLVLPWAGWRYAQQMETTLREGQEVALLTTAEVLGRVVASEPELLYRVRELATNFDASNGDLFAPLLSTAPLVDGFPDEWPIPARPVPGFSPDSANPDRSADRPTIRLGVHGRSMHVFIQVRTTGIVYEVPLHDERGAVASSDRIVILTRDEFGLERAWCLSAVAPGPLIVRTCAIGTPWTPTDDVIANVAGVWRETSDGYAIELRAPINAIGTQLAVHAIDDRQQSVATTPLAAVHSGSEALKARLERYAPTGTRVSVVDNHGWLLARAGAINLTPVSTDTNLQFNENGFARSVYRVLFAGSDATARAYGLPYGMWGTPLDEARSGEPKALWFEQSGGEPSLIRAAVPVTLGDQAFGALVVEQPGEQLVVVREIALTRLLNLTLVATLFTIIVTLVFAARLSHRIRRLSRAASTALSPEGRIEFTLPETRAGDEIGALARSYASLLTRMKEYTNYLQTLGTKLSHELRTPLTIVSSSLDNLSSEQSLDKPAADYLERARHGTARMHGILSALSEATRVEQSIEHTERVRFDLAALARNMALAYGQSFSRHHIETVIENAPCVINGSPDLIAQLLDKLMDNAADFAPAGATITLSLSSDARTARLSVQNEGPLLPPGVSEHVFESLVSVRPGNDTKPHLGLGLYIVRLIADFHGATVSAENLADNSGVRFTLELPRY